MNLSMPIATYETINEREITSTIFPSELNDFTAAWTKRMSLRNQSFVLLQLLRVVQVGISNFNPIHLLHLQILAGTVHRQTITEIRRLKTHHLIDIQTIRGTHTNMIRFHSTNNRIHLSQCLKHRFREDQSALLSIEWIETLHRKTVEPLRSYNSVCRRSN